MPKVKMQRGDENLRGRIIRMWRLIELLHTSPRGVSNAQIMRHIGGSRATLYRDLNVLRSAGVPVTSDTVNGEARHRLEHGTMPPLNPTPLQLLALRVARSILAPLEGLSLVRELDTFLGQTRAPSSAEVPLSIGGPVPPANPGVTTLVERALQERRRLAFDYQSPNSETVARRTVDPLAIRAVEGHLYLVAFDLDRQAARTFKLPRMRAVMVQPEPAAAHPEVDEEALFADSVKAWAGPSHDVVIRIPSRLMGVAAEWPLIAGQQVQDNGDGTAHVTARVAGLVEAMRWVLRWGADAEALDPPDLRRLVAAELSRAQEYYG